jgi:ParB family transcriptional regulator, chromosome partitioning protein
MGAKRGRRKKTAEPASRGLRAPQVAQGVAPAAVRALTRQLEADGGAVLATFRDPLGGRWQLLAAIPIERIKPTPFQRDLSDPHVERLAGAIGGLDRFLDPVIAVRADDGTYWTPNGYHRAEAMRRLGGRSLTALVIPERETAFRILALNTEKAHNLREKSLEVIRMARSLAELDPRPESEFALEFEEPAYLTLGICYERNGRFAGGAYQPVVRRVEGFLRARLPNALETRGRRADLLGELDQAVGVAVAALKSRGFESPYLKAFVVARVNPLRFQRGAKAEFDETIGKMLASARRFDAAKVKPGQVATAGGAPEE